ncbi:hypothetical protein [Nocardia farcinica]|uniref:hypothetical protein n=1 Tax=Nocardia farcinica TaxID=37329 RepID=UPI002454234F|nr:hypothetical protein [Nocardia farcinica]
MILAGAALSSPPDLSPNKIRHTGGLAALALVLLPSSAHVDPATLDRLMAIADVECASPRVSFARWSGIGGVHR